MSTTGLPVRGLRVSELARAAHVAPDTIRYYERAGLLPAPDRTPSGYRAYQPEAVERLRFIQGAQRLGLRLRDIADRLAELDSEVARLAALRAEMVTMITALPSQDCPPPAPGTWCPPERGEVTSRAETPSVV